MNKEVSFPIAKLLKEKGFDEVSQKWYSVEGSPYYRDELDNHRRFVPAYECEAPTVDEVKWWLYEKHGIWISVDTDINGRFRYSLRKYNITNGAWEVKNPTSISEYFNSPTEAYEAGIEYALNKLI